MAGQGPAGDVATLRLLSYCRGASILPRSCESVMPLPDKALVHRIVFGTDTPAGRRFDKILIVIILVSVLIAIVDSAWAAPPLLERFFFLLEWGFTAMFTVEYLLRLWSSPRPWRYATSFFGIVDLLATLPTYLAFFLPGASMLLVIRLVRVLRIFRVFKLLQYVDDANFLIGSLAASRQKILVFFSAILVAATVFGALLYVVEGPQHGFTSIPKAIYWAVITITTVGYGDLTPQTPIGQAIATVVMIVGYSVLAVPTGIVTSEMLNQLQTRRAGRSCPGCHASGHESDALYCRHCGTALLEPAAEADEL
ncbi:MAG: ion transporter [Moraxellaceae bacterium]|nr:ion transporter [Moraxellaceae bacterium]